MDRSLKFFTDLSGKKNNIDDITGLTKKDMSVQFSIDNYDPNDPINGATSTDEKTVNYTVLMSGQSDKKFVNYMGNSNVNDYDKYTINPQEESDILLSNIIQWTQNNHRAMELKPEHFIYLKDFRVYPANRLMILRRFSGPVNNNLFNSKARPLHTMVTYYDLEKSPVDITFNEKWADFQGSFMSVLQNVIGIQFDKIPGVGSVLNSNVGQFASQSNLGQELLTRIGQKLGFISAGGLPYGDPNIIYEAKVRDTSGEKDDMKSGLESNIKIDFETTYVMNEINGVDAKAAMLDIIGNVVHMGTSPERFYITGSASSVLRNLIRDMRDGNVSGIFNEVLTEIKSIISNTITKITETVKGTANKIKNNPQDALTALLGNLSDFAGEVLKTRYSRYKWSLIGAVSALSGGYTTPWHITIGNPKFPWFSCGNMLVTDVKMEAGGELGYNDMFTELKVKITLEAGRAYGADGLTELFNAGRGRIYDDVQKVQRISVPKDSEKKFIGNPNNVEEKETGTVEKQNEDPDKINELENNTPFSNNIEENSNTINKVDINNGN